MNIEQKYPVMIFKAINNGKTFYNLGLSRKDEKGNYINGYINCKFKKDVELEDKTKIMIKSAFLTFYLKDKITVPYIFISDFDLVDTSIQTMKNEAVEDPYAAFGNSITAEQIDDLPLDLPF